jgi:hypothetical protein
MSKLALVRRIRNVLCVNLYLQLRNGLGGGSGGACGRLRYVFKPILTFRLFDKNISCKFPFSLISGIIILLEKNTKNKYTVLPYSHRIWFSYSLLPPSQSSASVHIISRNLCGRGLYYKCESCTPTRDSYTIFLRVRNILRTRSIRTSC